MHVVVLFLNVGGYHAARLRAAQAACRERGWRLTALQVAGRIASHPWGKLEEHLAFPLETLLPDAAMSAESPENARAVEAKGLMARRLERLQPEALFITGWGCPFARAAFAWGRRRRLPLILMSESKADDARRCWWKEAVKSRCYVRRSHAALVAGRLHRDYLARLGMAPERIFLGYGAVDNDHFRRGAEAARRDPAAAHARCPELPERPYFLGLTRFLPRKNVPRLLQAYAAYRRRLGALPAWDLVLGGHGEEEGAIRDSVRRERLEGCVHLPGFIPYDRLGDWYGLAGALVHPALQEQWGLVLNEACAAGLPVLSSRTVGARYELVEEGRSGFLFEPASIAEMARALTSIHQLAPAARSAMGQHSCRLVAELGPERFASGFMEALEAARTAHAPSPRAARSWSFRRTSAS